MACFYFTTVVYAAFSEYNLYNCCTYSINFRAKPVTSTVCVPCRCCTPHKEHTEAHNNYTDVVHIRGIVKNVKLWVQIFSTLFDMLIQISSINMFYLKMWVLYTGSFIYIGTHSFNLTCSHDRYPSNFKTTFICYYKELSFEVYNFFLSQQA